MKKVFWTVIAIIIVIGLITTIKYAFIPKKYDYVYDLSSLVKSNIEAQKILYETLCGDEKTEAIAFADYIDLNDDGVNEIIGFDYSTNCGHLNYCFYILKKENNEYKRLGSLALGRDFQEIKILKNKTNNFHDIEAVSSKKNRVTRIIRINELRN